MPRPPCPTAGTRRSGRPTSGSSTRTRCTGTARSRSGVGWPWAQGRRGIRQSAAAPRRAVGILSYARPMRVDSAHRRIAALREEVVPRLHRPGHARVLAAARGHDRAPRAHRRARRRRLPDGADLRVGARVAESSTRRLRRHRDAASSRSSRRSASCGRSSSPPTIRRSPERCSWSGHSSRTRRDGRHRRGDDVPPRNRS